jgi:small subunit ribosomal protein S18
MTAAKKDSSAGKNNQASKYRKVRKKVCAFCAEKIVYIDYKNVNRLRRFISDRGKILPRRTTGTCAAHQRSLANAIKRAREIALLPFTAE